MICFPFTESDWQTYTAKMIFGTGTVQNCQKIFGYLTNKSYF